METIIVEAFTDYHFGANCSFSNPHAQLDVRNLNNNMLAIQKKNKKAPEPKKSNQNQMAEKKQISAEKKPTSGKKTEISAEKKQNSAIKTQSSGKKTEISGEKKVAEKVD